MLVVTFCDERIECDEAKPFTIGRDADLVVDENPYLHRHFLTIQKTDGIWWLSNTGSLLSATVGEPLGRLQAWLSPGARLPLVFPEISVRFTAGSTTYEIQVEVEGTPFSLIDPGPPASMTITQGSVPLTADQRLLLVGLAEKVLRGDWRTGASIPTSSETAARLGWTLTKFNRKLDNVCDKLTKAGIQGLRGESGALASSRRARLIGYALSARLVSKADLGLLDAGGADESSTFASD